MLSDLEVEAEVKEELVDVGVVDDGRKQVVEDVETLGEIIMAV